MRLLQYILITLLFSVIILLCYLGHEVNKVVKTILLKKQVMENIIEKKDLLKNFIK